MQDSYSVWIITGLFTALASVFWWFVKTKYQETKMLHDREISELKTDFNARIAELREDSQQKYQEILVSIRYVQELSHQILNELHAQNEKNTTFTKRLDSHKKDIERMIDNFADIENRVLLLEAWKDNHENK